MKIFYLTASIILTAMILILAFENINASCNSLYFFFLPIDQSSSPTLIVLGLVVIGILAGAVYHAFAIRALGPDEEEENESL